MLQPDRFGRFARRPALQKVTNSTRADSGRFSIDLLIRFFKPLLVFMVFVPHLAPEGVWSSLSLANDWGCKPASGTKPGATIVIRRRPCLRLYHTANRLVRERGRNSPTFPTYRHLGRFFFAWPVVVAFLTGGVVLPGVGADFATDVGPGLPLC
jgi:hypothetical protein